MHDHWPSEARFEIVFLPREVLVIPFIFLVENGPQFFLLSDFVLVLSVLFLNLGCILALELQVEANRELEVALNGAALMRALKGIVDLDVDLWSVEGSITGVQGPWLAELVQSIFKSFFRGVPELVGTKTHLRPSREVQIECESENAVNVLQEVK